jgi:dihydroorotase
LPVVNAGESGGEDVASGTSLLATMRRKVPAPTPLQVAVCGDLGGSRSAQALLGGLTALDAAVLLVPAQGCDLDDDLLERLAGRLGGRPARFAAQSMSSLLDMVDTVVLSQEEAPQLPLFEEVDVPPGQNALRVRRHLEELDFLFVAARGEETGRLVHAPFRSGRNLRVPEGALHTTRRSAVEAVLRFAAAMDLEQTWTGEGGRRPEPGSKGSGRLERYRAPEGLGCDERRCVQRRFPDQVLPDFAVVSRQPWVLECLFCGRRTGAAFVGSRQEQRYHPVDHGVARSILPENRVLFVDEVQAHDAGFEPPRRRSGPDETGQDVFVDGLSASPTDLSPDPLTEPRRGPVSEPNELPLRLTGARVLDPATGTDEVLDLWLDATGVHRSDPGWGAGARTLDLTGKLVCPAFVEIHAHLREPGGDAETIASGLAAARAGGFGHVVAMANTQPTNDDPEVTRLMLRRAAESGSGVRLYPVSAVTRGLAGAEAAPWTEQLAAGCVALSDDGKPVADDAMLERMLAYCAEHDVPYLSHAECPALFHGPIHDGEAARRFGVEGIPIACESRAVAQEIEVAERLGARLHVCHISTTEAIDAVQAAQARGVQVSAEATPHHLALTEEAFLTKGPDTALKMNPPLRTEADRQRLVTALRDGVVGAVATDHAPHSAARKSLPLEEAPFGVIGMETAFCVLHEQLVRTGTLSLMQLVDRLTRGPADLLRLAAGRLFEGAPALVVLDAEAPWCVDPSTFLSASRNCPFAGWSGRGRVMATLLDGRFEPSDAPGAAPEHG